MEIKEEITTIIRNRLKLPEKASNFTDIRHTPQIPLQEIILCCCLMPSYGLKSLLRLDFQSRKRSFKLLFRKETSRRKMVSSDSTLQRILRWLSQKESEIFQLSFLSSFIEHGAHSRRLAPDGPVRKIGIIDGSCMGTHHLCALALAGKLSYPALIEGYPGRGRELEAAQRLIRSAGTRLGQAKPELLLLDALYFNRPIFTLARENGFHLLIKSSHPSFRAVLQEAQFRFSLGPLSVEKISRCSGYDPRRLCSWTLETTSGSFADYPVTVSHLTETFSKHPGSPPHEAWIVTTDMSLSPAELREAAYARRSIENDVFKKLSHLAGTKRFHFKDPYAFLALLRILCAALAAFELALLILSLAKELFKSFRDGIKSTLFGLFSRLVDFLEDSVFA